MAYGSELYLGMIGIKETQDTLKSLGLGFDVEQYGYFIHDNPASKAIRGALKIAHKDALEERGLKIIPASSLNCGGKSVKADPHYVYVQGLDGVVRQTCVWGLEVDYDPMEMGHRPDDVLVGVSLISRYFPVYLDWDKEHGGSGDGIALTMNVLKDIEIARKHIEKVLPFIKTAPIVFRERHY